MKLTQKKISFNGNNQKMYYEQYDNYKEFLDTVLKRQNENPNKTLEEIFYNHGSRWVGVNSVDEAKDLLINGWQKEVEKLKLSINKELDSIERKSKLRSFSNVQGFMPIVPHAIMRLPNSMIDVRMESKKSKIIKFMIVIDRAGYNSVDDIIKVMAKQLAIIASLERSGQYRCRIEALFCPFEDGYPNKTICPCSVMVKRESQPFDLKRLAFPIIHPAMLRLLMFAWEESLPLERSDYHYSGYGKSFEWWNKKSKSDFIKAITDGNEKTIVVDLHTDLEKLLKEGGVK